MPWRAWYGDEELELALPDAWTVSEHWPAGGPAIDDAAIDRALDQPVGAPTLEELVRGKKTAAFALEDISRPCDSARIFPLLLRRLEAGGIKRENVSVVFSVGTHRAMVKGDFIKKVGQDAADTLAVHNSFPYANLVDLGKTRRGTPVHINRYFAEADVKIGVGTITPHGGPGLGGGAKIVVPGVAGFETIKSIHQPGRLSQGINRIEGNELREEVEEIALEHLGLDWIANALIGPHREILALYAGHVVKAHRAGVEPARRAYATRMPTDPVDVVITNAYPKDTEWYQCGNALNVIRSCEREVLRRDGTTVIITASPEGRGNHGLYGLDMPYYNPRPSGEANVIFSPNLTRLDTRNDYTLNTTEQLVAHLEKRHGPSPRVAVFPCGSIQLGTL
jgi:nickel-dependent lactate racemase